MVTISVVKRLSSANEVGNQAITASAHATNDNHILRSGKGSIPAAMFNDAQRNDPTNPWQTFEIGSLGEVDIDSFRPLKRLTPGRNVL